MLDIIAWGVGPFIISSEKSIALNIRRQMYLIRQLYDSPQDFLADKDFSLLESNQQRMFGDMISTEPKEKESYIQGRSVAESGLIHFNIEKSDEGNVVGNIEIDQSVLFSNSLYMGHDANKQFQEHFNNFLKTVNPKVPTKINEGLPGLCQPPKANLITQRGSS
jgi:hypothetical protein